MEFLLVVSSPIVLNYLDSETKRSLNIYAIFPTYFFLLATPDLLRECHFYHSRMSSTYKESPKQKVQINKWFQEDPCIGYFAEVAHEQGDEVTNREEWNINIVQRFVWTRCPDIDN